MVFYDKDSNKYTYSIEDKKPVGEGMKAKIYKISSSECLKVLHCDPNCYFDEDTFSEIKSLSLKGLVRLGTPFYSGGKLKDYIMEYIEKSKVSILDMPIDYTIDNINALYNDLSILADNSIEVHDLFEGNLIVGSSKVTLIDLDDYVKRPSADKKMTLYSNTWFLLYAFKRLYQAELMRKGYDLCTTSKDNITINHCLSDMFDYNIDEIEYKTNPAVKTKRKLQGVKTPIELFTEK